MLFGPRGFGLYMLGSEQPMAFDDATTREVLNRPGIVADISSAYDSPVKTVDGWVALIDQLRWIGDDQVDRFTGSGPLVTDDHPLPEYFLLRRAFNQKVPDASRDLLISLTPH